MLTRLEVRLEGPEWDMVQSALLEVGKTLPLYSDLAERIRKARYFGVLRDGALEWAEHETTVNRLNELKESKGG